MIWQNWGDFLAMGGYGLYVWGSIAAVFGLLALEVTALRLRAKSIARRHLLQREDEFMGAADENAA